MESRLTVIEPIIADGSAGALCRSGVQQRSAPARPRRRCGSLAELPRAALGTCVDAFARGLAHPQWLHVLPSGDVRVAESNAPPEPAGSAGLYASFGMARGPDGGRLWTVVNERDEPGSDFVPDYLTSLQDGGFYGWRYSHFGASVDSRVRPAEPGLLARTLVPDDALGSHTASLGPARPGLGRCPGRVPRPGWLCRRAPRGRGHRCAGRAAGGRRRRECHLARQPAALTHRVRPSSPRRCTSRRWPRAGR